jgi:hypothetical protein
MAEVHSYKIDLKYGVPDRLIKEFVSDCEKQMGFVRVTMQVVPTGTATMLCVVVVKADSVIEEGL